MRFDLPIWAAALGLTDALASPGTGRRRDENEISALSGTKKFIVEVEQGAQLTDLSQKIEATGAKVLKSFNSEVFSGLSVESGSDNLDTLQSLREVSQAWPVKTYKLAPLTPQASFSDDATAQNWSTHYSTGVDKLHEAGVFGKGAKVAVIDSGVDYRHPALGGGFGPGFKVSGGYDLVGEGDRQVSSVVINLLTAPDYDGSNEKVPDDDPLDSLGHGTHVAGIIAGKSEFYAGVAPEAEILAFKVFGAFEGTDEDTLIDATIMAYESGADIITASIGRAAGFSDGPWATVASRIVEQGVVVTIAAGNDGDEGPFYASSGSSGKEVLAVASVDTSRVPAKPWHATFSAEGVSNTTQLAYIPPVNRPLWNVTGLPIVPLSFDTKASAEACNTLPESTPDLSNFIVLVRRGGCTQYVKQTNVEKFGAKYMLIYNDDYRPFELVANSAYKSQMALIDAKAGAAIIETVKAGGNVTADFTNPADPNWAVGFFDAAGGIPSQYSSWGGTYELEIKPDIAAPGASIYSTYLDKTWKVLSGTNVLDVKPLELVPEVALPTDPFIVNPGETRTAEFGFKYPQVDDESKLPIYSGKVIISSGNGDALSVPYLGAAFDLKAQMTEKMFPDGYPLQRSGPSSLGIETYHTYAFNTSRVAQDFPKVHVQLKWGTKELRWDIFDDTYEESQWKYPPVVGQDGYIGSATYSTYSVGASTFDPATMDRDKVLPFPIRGIERTTSWSELTDRFWWLGKLANGSYIAAGNYT
ncbi:hypothetical protein K4K49_005440 [Colletotrichum sp. SAR 10_70]|nr:hypothetical protein K4K49_005440 [Colletotrichum sp. SAR 10_70]KAI8247753.1 hypothetical protein K4K53_001500 [Colletotrichum sp. SAR 10_77]